MVVVRKGVRELVAAAEAEVEALTPAEAQAGIEAGELLPVDLRDIRELTRGGKIPSAMHVPRGMLEFWVDPQSPYYRSELGEAPKVLLYCASGWRSALAAKALLDMGAEEGVCHLDGGFNAWVETGASVETVDKKG